MTDRVEAAGFAYIESGGAPAVRNAAESSVICSRRRRPLFANGSNDLSGCSSSGAGKSRKDWICFRSTDLNLAEGHACTRSGNGGAGSGDSLVRRAGCVRRRAFACGSSPVGLVGTYIPISLLCYSIHTVPARATGIRYLIRHHDFIPEVKPSAGMRLC